jgi:hypothetical protein
MPRRLVIYVVSIKEGRTKDGKPLVVKEFDLRAPGERARLWSRNIGPDAVLRSLHRNVFKLIVQASDAYSIQLVDVGSWGAIFLSFEVLDLAQSSLRGSPLRSKLISTHATALLIQLSHLIHPRVVDAISACPI